MTTDEGRTIVAPQCDYDGEMTSSLEEAIRAAGVRWWGTAGRKRYTCSDLDGTIADYLEVEHGRAPAIDPLAMFWCESVTVTGVAHRSALGFFTPAELLERLREEWDDEYGLSCPIELTVEAERLATLLIAELERGNPYSYWGDPVIEVRVDVRAWIARHRPDWIDTSERSHP